MSCFGEFSFFKTHLENSLRISIYPFRILGIFGITTALLQHYPHQRCSCAWLEKVDATWVWISSIWTFHQIVLYYYANHSHCYSSPIQYRSCSSLQLIEGSWSLCLMISCWRIWLMRVKRVTRIASYVEIHYYISVSLEILESHYLETGWLWKPLHTNL